MANTNEVKKVISASELEALQEKNKELEKSAAELEDIKKRNAELENSLAELKEMMANLSKANTQPLEPMVSKGDDMVSLISNTDAEVDIPFNTWRLRFARIGQKNRITLAQFNELVNIHRFYLDSEFFLLSSEHLDLAKDFDLPVMDDSGKYIRPADLDKVAKMNTTELVNYYNGLSEATKRNFASYYLGRCNAKTPGYYDIEKMRTMNMLTNGHLFDMMINICFSESK